MRPSTAPPTRVQQVVLGLVAAGIVFLAIRQGWVNRDGIIFFAVLIPSIILHEISHGVVALAFGDDTAKKAGRLTLNPIVHIDPFGTILLPALLILSGSGRAFGFAKPVPVRVNRLRNPRAHALFVSLAGPFTNLLLVALATLLWHALRPHGTVAQAVLNLGVANVVLGMFNLIPIPPLDGSALVERVLPTAWLEPYLRLRQYSMLIVLAVFLFRPGLFSTIIDPALRLWAHFL